MSGVISCDLLSVLELNIKQTSSHTDKKGDVQTLGASKSLSEKSRDERFRRRCSPF